MFHLPLAKIRCAVLRVARFAARYAHLGFRIADETMTLMRDMTTAGELEHLTPERVWKETEGALTTRNPQVFFRSCATATHCASCFRKWMLCLAFQPAQWHPEIDTGIHTLMTLSMALHVKSGSRRAFCYAVPRSWQGIDA